MASARNSTACAWLPFTDIPEPAKPEVLLKALLPNPYAEFLGQPRKAWSNIPQDRICTVSILGIVIMVLGRCLLFG